MAESAPQELKQIRMKEFLTLLPLTAEIAGLPQSASGTLFNEGQMEARVISLRIAFKLARQLMKDVGENGI